MDVDAIASAETSARLNTLPDTMEFRVADFRTSRPSVARIVLANLTGGMLTSSAPIVGALVAPDGQMILSGFDHTEVAAVIAAFPDFEEESRLSEDNWLALRLRRRSLTLW